MEKSVGQDPKTNNTSIWASNKARISSIEEDDDSVGHPHMGNKKKPAPKKRGRMLVRATN